MYKILIRLLANDEGAVHAEYALLAVLIAVIAFGAVTLFGESVLALFERFPLSIFD